MPARSLSFVIPVKDDAARLRVCLTKIRERVPADVSVDVVVADNGSTDDSAAVAAELGAKVLSLPHARVGELRNRAARETRGEILAFVDADNEIGPAWIATAVEALSDPSVAAVGAPYVAPSPGTWVQRLYDRLRRHPTTREAVSWLGSGNMAVRRSAFEAVGGFDIALETCEDVDLCRKLRAAGQSIVADRQMRNVHHGDPRTLGQVFFGELWRGRDNIRVSLRPPWSGRTLISAAMPMANLLAAVLALAGVASGSRTGWWIAGASAAYVIVTVALRASVMTRNSGVADWPAACAVAAAYEAGRALSIAGRFGYRRRRPVAAA